MCARTRAASHFMITYWIMACLSFTLKCENDLEQIAPVMVMRSKLSLNSKENGQDANVTKCSNNMPALMPPSNLALGIMFIFGAVMLLERGGK